jgi:3-oxoacyl-[acyl-carrier protein] reductase
MVMNVNLRAAFVGGKLAARQMIRQGGGVIVNAASFTAVMPVAGHGPYSVSKWGINGFTRVLAAELACHNIRVFSFVPGMIETDINRSRVSVNREYYAKQAVANRVGDPDDLAPTLVMLTSDRAPYFTGGCVEISGGKFCVQNPHYSWEAQARKG